MSLTPLPHLLFVNLYEQNPHGTIGFGYASKQAGDQAACSSRRACKQFISVELLVSLLPEKQMADIADYIHDTGVDEGTALIDVLSADPNDGPWLEPELDPDRRR